ncbi:MAG: glycine cleavage system aminomethyltransferase GcvT, partial [Deltaproteobacteria bacterium]|nr:glycine cleavage system aminomethyltransferase GcvT [Deltaproteobacteria bacterium]
MTKKIPLYNEHVQLGAKMVPFAGFDMPVQYKGVVEEHNTVRHTAGLFDVSHMGEFSFTGAEALPFLNYLTANNVAKLVDGQAQYSLLCNKTGGLVDDILVYRKSADDFIMVVNASNIEKDWNWIIQNQKSKIKDQNDRLKIKNISEETCLLALQGPKAVEIIQKLTDAPITGLKTFRFVTATLAGQKDCILARTGYTGEDGVEIFCKNEQAVPLWKAILKTGAPYGAQPI